MLVRLPFRRVAALIPVAALAIALLPGLATAHADLVTATPADNSTVTPPVAEVSGVYSEAMSPNGSSLTVSNTNGETVAAGMVDPADNTRMVATPATPLGIGTYTVKWTSVALDGHVERGTWTFTAGISKPVGSPAPSVRPTAGTPAAGTPSASPVQSAGPSASPSGAGSTKGSDPGDVALPILLALIVLGAGAAYLLSRRNRPADPT